MRVTSARALDEHVRRVRPLRRASCLPSHARDVRAAEMRGPARPVPRGIPSERHADPRAFAPGRRPDVRDAAPRDAPSRHAHPSHLVGAHLSRGARRDTPLAGRTLPAPAQRRERTPPSVLETHTTHPAAMEIPRQNSAPRRVSPLARHASLRRAKESLRVTKTPVTTTRARDHHHRPHVPERARVIVYYSRENIPVEFYKLA